MQQKQKERIAALSLALAGRMAAELPETTGNLVLFDELLDEIALRELVNLLTVKCRVAAVFSGSGEQWHYIIGSRCVDLRKGARSINAAIGGRGGGSPAMIQGQASADREQIRVFFEKFESLDTYDQNV